MNAESNLKSIDDLRAWLEAMGVTTQGLLIVAAVATLLFVLSLREVLSWYLKVQHLRSEIRAMSAQVSEMQKSGVETYFECGHGKVLNGLIKKIDANARVLNLNSLDDLKLIETTEGLL